MKVKVSKTLLILTKGNLSYDKKNMG